MRSFLPGQESFRWLAIITIILISALGAFGYFRPAADAPEAVPAAAAPPAEVPPPVFAIIPERKSVPTVSFVDFSARMGPIDPPVAIAVAAPPAAVPEGPAAAPPAIKTSARCARAIYRMPAIKRESLFDDMETKYEAARTAANRRFAAHEKCMREIVPHKGG